VNSKSDHPILIKLSGELLSVSPDTHSKLCCRSAPRNAVSSPRCRLDAVSKQIKELSKNHNLGIVIGGGNFFRGGQHGKAIGSTSKVGHTVGMFATIMNGLLLKDIFEQSEIEVTLLSSIEIPGIVDKVSQEKIEQAKQNNQVIIFVGGTGKPFFTTDTAAVLRAKEIGSTVVFKATQVDGVYSSDPKKNLSARKIDKITCEDAIKMGLKIVDESALAMAEENGINIRVFAADQEDSLLLAESDPSFGSTIVPYIK
jgi:uridylate kinase